MCPPVRYPILGSASQSRQFILDSLVFININVKETFMDQIIPFRAIRNDLFYVLHIKYEISLLGVKKLIKKGRAPQGFPIAAAKNINRR